MQPALAPAPHPSMQNPAQDHADQVLHDQLLAAQHQNYRPQGAPGQQQHLQPNTASPRDQANIDPAISGAMMAAAPQTPTQPQQASPENVTPKSYGKRELSTSKRAAQNRAAQRAFRQRKETYIRKLEEEVKGVEGLREQLKHLINENYSLREYVINLQSRLMDAQAEVPELPPNIDLSQPRHELALAAAGISAAGSQNSVPTTNAPQQQHGGTANDDMNSLNRIAVAGLGMRKHPDETNFMGGNFQPNKRRDDNQGDGSDGLPKQEGHHGLPMA
ncbi:transcription factor kapC [Penicillium macrosclerotiorum]|uniref:transcription factor kapC n=1 Tax=Penicillium macrosclerotiorum TaxID=303699 RepID=UPI0025498944|nr:transcription factor kapC [Penicillium macrosclerotiorum]KAJ5691817.1 transcription factor kapC [Penicillium macrosclerotiorum]